MCSAYYFQGQFAVCFDQSLVTVVIVHQGSDTPPATEKPAAISTPKPIPASSFPIKPAPVIHSAEEAAQILEEKGLCDYAAALRGESDNPYDVLVEALRDPQVPSHFKNVGGCHGPIRTAIGKIVSDSKKAKEEDKLVVDFSNQAISMFVHFQDELARLSFCEPGKETNEAIRRLSQPFFDHENGSPPMVKVLETMIKAGDNSITRILADDIELAEIVAGAGDRVAGALINALQKRAINKTQASPRSVITFRKQVMRPGKTARDRAKKNLLKQG